MNYLTLLDKNYLRIPTRQKVPLRKDWSLPIHHYYKEPLTIAQLLQTYGEYGIRCGLFVRKDYHLASLYFRFTQAELDYFINLFPTTSYTQTENGLYYWTLIKELPPSCELKNKQQKTLGNFYGSGKLVIGAGSKINNFIYCWVKREQSYLIFNSLKELKKTLTKLKIKLNIQGKVKLNKTKKEWTIPTKLKTRWKKRNFARAKLKVPKLVQCLDCKRKVKPNNLLKHLLKIHPKRNRKRRKFFRLCRRCKLNYSTLIKAKEHRKFYCFKVKASSK